MAANPLLPQTALLAKIASLVVHADELLSPNGHQFDRDAFTSLIQDQEVREWIDAMTELALAPKKRSDA